MSDGTATPVTERDHRSHRWIVGVVVVVTAIAAAFLLLPTLAGVPRQLIRGCGGWIALAGALEILSGLGFVVVWKLVFAPRVGWRLSAIAGLQALGASTILPAGGWIGPSTGAWTAGAERPSLSQLSRRTLTFVILTNVPGATVLVALGTLLWLGVPSGSQPPGLTILPAALAAGLLALTWHAGRSRHPASPRRRATLPPKTAQLARALRDGLVDARTLISGRDRKLLGGVAYYLFDNAVLWAAFHAYGYAPPLAVVAMGYLVGSLAGALPVPGGLGAVEGGLVGALLLYGVPALPASAAVLLYRGISLSVPVLLGFTACTRRAAKRPSGPRPGDRLNTLYRRAAPRSPRPAGSGNPVTDG